ncbi:MAG: DUF4160 domain-containing protein [Armatimonadetes bacterium]|nr:DUF4160 domain-containing protein [Armatimonadota bacterium]
MFYSSDGGEPPHVHITRDRLIAKVWLDPVALAKNRGFAGRERNHVVRLTSEHEAEILEAWREFFGS